MSGRRETICGRKAERSAWNGRRGSGSSRRRRSCPRGWREGRTGGSEGGGLSQKREGRPSESDPGPPSHFEIDGSLEIGGSLETDGRTAENGLPSTRSPSQAL